ncbi:hypothetical protein [Alkalihalobacterium sp. APHAB7]|uniref:hypothetical protein n=1 Tax=Alkalihalobacterium sp. APHAB7 TaxID=3402081 RepID=UPI003AAAA82C
MIQTNYTGDMEKAMQQNHGIGYEEYNRSLEKRLEIEKARERDYKRSIKLAIELKQR